MIEARQGSLLGKLLTVALAAVLAVGMIGFLPTVAAHAAESDIDIQPALRVDTDYAGIAVNFSVANMSEDASNARVTVQRAVGPDVVKVTRDNLSVINILKTGEQVTAPVITQQGTYSESGSGSWEQPVNAVWTAETIPTRITVEVLDAEGAVLKSNSIEPPFTSFNGATMSDILPALPTFTTPTAGYHTGNYTGVVVDVRTSGFTDATAVIVKVDRSDGSSAIKRNQANGSVLTSVNTGKTVTVPIVIQPGTYDEDGSSSWIKPGAVWTSTTIPELVTITIERAYGPDLVKTFILDVPPEGIMPSAAATPEVTVPANQPVDQPFVVDVPAGAENMNLKLGTASAGAVLVQANVVVNTPTGVSVAIPANTTVTGSASWDGVISLPTVVEDVTVPATVGQNTTVGLAIQVGSATEQINFDRAVKIVLPGQAGKSAGFIGHDDVFHAIVDKCGATPENLTSGECWANDGDDLVIWTTHFTTFLSYSVTATGGGAGGAGDTLANTGSANLAPALGAVGLMALLGLGLITAGRVRRQGARR